MKTIPEIRRLQHKIKDDYIVDGSVNPIYFTCRRRYGRSILNVLEINARIGKVTTVLTLSVPNLSTLICLDKWEDDIKEKAFDNQMGQLYGRRRNVSIKKIKGDPLFFLKNCDNLYDIIFISKEDYMDEEYLKEVFHFAYIRMKDENSCVLFLNYPSIEFIDKYAGNYDILSKQLVRIINGRVSEKIRKLVEPKLVQKPKPKKIKNIKDKQ